MTIRAHYQVSMPRPETHYYEVQMDLEGDFPAVLHLYFPTWTPGSYLIREYARHVCDLRVECDGQPSDFQVVDKAGWTIPVDPGSHKVIIFYRVYAYELSVRGNYLDADYGLATGAALFAYLSETKGQPCLLSITPFSKWDVSVGLPYDADAQQFRAQDYDQLADTAIQLGRLGQHSFAVDGITHWLTLGSPDGQVPPLPRPSFIDDLKGIVQEAETLFEGLPYPGYRFMFTIANQGDGGLEHRDSANILVSRQLWHDPSHYHHLLHLCAHEYFHAWNVKRIHPEQLGPFNYQTEVYSRLLWAMEGVTDYFAQWLLVRSHRITPQDALKGWAERFCQLESQPGRLETSLADASFQAWIRQYRPDSNTPNITISYYLKGSLVGLLLDLAIRQFSGASLAQAFKTLWQKFGTRGFEESQFDAAIIEAGGAGMKAYLDEWVYRPGELPTDMLSTVGLTLERNFKEDPPLPFLGIRVEARQQRLYVKFVERNSPGESSGIGPGDEIIALNDYQVKDVDGWNNALRRQPVGEEMVVQVFHDGYLRAHRITPENPKPDQYRLKAVENPSSQQQERFAEWLGVPYEAQDS